MENEYNLVYNLKRFCFDFVFGRKRRIGKKVEKRQTKYWAGAYRMFAECLNAGTN